MSKGVDERRQEIKSKIQRKSRERANVYLGAALIIVIFAFILFSTMQGSPAGDETKSNMPTPKPTPEPTANPTPKKETKVSLSIPPPSIRINSPVNKTYNTSIPPVNFVVAGSSLDTVILSINGKNITIPHDGSLAVVENSMPSKSFYESFESPDSLRYWSNPGPAFSASIDNEDGEKSLRVSTYSTKGWSWISRVVDVIPGVSYKIMTKIKGRNVLGTHVAIDGYSDGWTRLINVPGGQKGSFDWREFSSLVYIPEKVKMIRVSLNAGGSDGVNEAVSWFDCIKIFPYPPVQEVNGKMVIFIDALKDGDYDFTIFANNTAGNSTSAKVHFKIKTQKEEEKEFVKGMRDTLIKENISVKLESYSPDFAVESGGKQLEYARVNLTIANLGGKEIELSFNPYKPALIGYENRFSESKIYKYIDLKIKREDGVVITHPDQITPGILPPKTKVSGALFFYPTVGSEIEELKLLLYLNGEKFEFRWDRSRLG